MNRPGESYMAQVLPGVDLSYCPTLSEIIKQCPCTLMVQQNPNMGQNWR